MSVDDKVEAAREALQSWVDKQGHEQCWYYPEIFRELCEILEVEARRSPNLPPIEEFNVGCARYRNEIYKL